MINGTNQNANMRMPNHQAPLQRGFLSGSSSNLMAVGSLAMGVFWDDAFRRRGSGNLQAAGTALSRFGGFLCVAPTQELS